MPLVPSPIVAVSLVVILIKVFKGGHAADDIPAGLLAGLLYGNRFLEPQGTILQSRHNKEGSCDCDDPHHECISKDFPVVANALPS